MIPIELGSHYVSRTFYVYLYLELHRDPGWRFVDSKSALHCNVKAYTAVSFKIDLGRFSTKNGILHTSGFSAQNYNFDSGE